LKHKQTLGANHRGNDGKKYPRKGQIFGGHHQVAKAVVRSLKIKRRKTRGTGGGVAKIRKDERVFAPVSSLLGGSIKRESGKIQYGKESY